MAEISDPVGQQAREKEGGAAEEEEIEYRPQPHGYGSQCDDSSYACSYREGDEAGGNEDARQQQVVR